MLGDARIPELDGLRGIAILVVMIKHYGIYHWPWPSGSVVGTFVGRVFPQLHAPDVFFVLTGFLLGGRLLADSAVPNYYSRFYVRRLCRTLPLYYILVAMFTVSVLARERLAEFVPLDVGWPFGKPWALLTYAVFLQSIWIAAEGHYGPNWLAVTWTLGVQEPFYLALPRLMRCGQRWRSAMVFGGLFLLAPVCRLCVVCCVPNDRWSGFDCVVFCRSDTLAVGVLAALALRCVGVQAGLMRAGWVLFISAAALGAGFAIATAAGFNERSALGFVLCHSYRAIMYVVFVLVAVSAPKGVVGSVLRWATLRHIGKVSYGLYLFHIVIRDLINGSAFGTLVAPSGWMRWLAVTEAFGLTLVVASASWIVVEKPFIGWSRVWGRSNIVAQRVVPL